MTKKETEPIILLSAALLFIFLMGILKVADYDVFFHLATGKHILETGQIIHSPDPFSYTSANPMSVATWLTGVVFYEVQNLSGIDGLIIFNAAIITLMFLVLYLNMRAISSESSWNKYLFPLMLLITAFALRMWFFIRPFIFEFLLLSLYFYILNQYRFKGKNYMKAMKKILDSNKIGQGLSFQYHMGQYSCKQYHRCSGSFDIFDRRRGKISSGVESSSQ